MNGLFLFNNGGVLRFNHYKFAPQESTTSPLPVDQATPFYDTRRLASHAELAL